MSDKGGKAKDAPDLSLKSESVHTGKGLQMGANPHKGRVVMVFNHSINYASLDPHSAEQFAHRIIEAARLARRSANKIKLLDLPIVQG